jgi:hypothetical protein
VFDPDIGDECPTAAANRIPDDIQRERVTIEAPPAARAVAAAGCRSWVRMAMMLTSPIDVSLIAVHDTTTLAQLMPSGGVHPHRILL